MFCNKCGKEIASGYLCEECQLEKVKTPSKNVKLCKKCGKEIGASADYCGICQREIDRKKNAINTKICKNCGASIPQSAIYCSKCNKMANVDTRSPVVYQDKGSFGAGWALGFLLGVIGLIIALCIGKQETTRGAKWGFAIYVVITVVVLIFYACVVVPAMKAGGGI